MDGGRKSVSLCPTATKECKGWEKYFSPGESTAADYPHQKVSPENTHTNSIIQTKQAVLRNVCAYMYIQVDT